MQVSGWVGYDLSVITAQIDGRSQDICFGPKGWHYQTLCTQADDFYQYGNRPLSDNTKTPTSAGVLVTPRLQPTQLDTCTSQALKICKCLAGLTTRRTVICHTNARALYYRRSSKHIGNSDAVYCTTLEQSFRHTNLPPFTNSA